MAASTQFEVRISVTCKTPEQEDTIARAIAAQFMRMGVKHVTVIAGDKAINYVNEQSQMSSFADLFSTDPTTPVDVYVVGHPKQAQ